MTKNRDQSNAINVRAEAVTALMRLTEHDDPVYAILKAADTVLTTQWLDARRTEDRAINAAVAHEAAVYQAVREAA